MKEVCAQCNDTTQVNIVNMSARQRQAKLSSKLAKAEEKSALKRKKAEEKEARALEVQFRR